MSSEKKAFGVLFAVLVWCVILVILGATYKLVIAPYFSGRLMKKTGSDPKYQHTVNVALDSFSGYCILRSPALTDQLKAEGIKLDFEDDQADYEGRMKAIKSGKFQMAVFTIDSFIMSGSKLGDFPASIVMVIDETKGADAIVAYKDAVGSIRELDHPDARIVMTPSSPSEFLARIVLAHFSLPGLPSKWWINKDGAEDVYKEFRSNKSADKYAYALWEPYVSKALEEPGSQILIDSGQLKGYIVDVLVAERRFLKEEPEIAKKIVEAYLRSAYSYNSREGGLSNLIVEDASSFGSEKLKKTDADKLAKGIQWKNTLENYAHFGLLSASQTAGSQHLEDMIDNIMDVLIKTDAIGSNPVEGRINTLFYDRALRDLHAANFHPGRKVNILKGPDVPQVPLDEIRQDVNLPKLSEDQWNALVPVGELQIKPISFARGTARINVQSQRELDKLARTMKSLPTYYLIVTGNARADGDQDANIRLAEERASTAAKTLSELGLELKRIKAVAAKPSKGKGTAQSVSFIVGQAPY